MATQIAVKDKSGTVRGQIDADTLILKRRRDRHYLLSYGGWGINSHVWHVTRHRVRRVRINEPDTGDSYIAFMKELREKERSGELETIRFEDEQRVLKEEWFTRIESEQGRLF